jgi:hypothetical protein
MEAAFGIELGELAKRVKGWTKEAFVAKFPLPCLVVDFSSEMQKEKMYDTHTSTDKKSSTMLSTGGEVAPAPGMGTQFVQFLEKSDRNTFAGKITVGRAVNNDLIIPDLSVSKLHGFFTETSRNPRFQDVGSTNGTFLEGKRADENRPVQIRSGAVMHIGTVPTYFFLPSDLFEYISIYIRMKNLG